MKQFLSNEENVCESFLPFVKETYHALLKLPGRPVPLTENAPATDLFLWQNYFMFCSVSLSKEDQRESYEFALSRISNKLERRTVWDFYLQHTKANAHETEGIEVMNKLVVDNPAQRESVHLDHQEQFKDKRLYHLNQIEMIQVSLESRNNFTYST